MSEIYKDEEHELEFSLEKEFELVYNSHIKEIESKLAIASHHLREAQALAEQYGIPFSSSISFIHNSYMPTSFDKKFGQLDQDFVSDFTGVYDPYGDYSSGWVHSAVC